MTDSLTKEHRSWNMSRIRSKNTKPEIIVRSLLHRMGYRFTVNGQQNRHLPGKPDIVLPKYKTVIFIHGCFWHRHRHCKYAYIPKSRVAFWMRKFDENKQRDKRVVKLLKKRGWKLLVVWECEIERNPEKIITRLSQC